MLLKDCAGAADVNQRLCEVLRSGLLRPRSTWGLGTSLDARVALAVAMACVFTAVAVPRVAAQTDADEEYVGPLITQALENEKTGVEVPWTNPATGSSGTIVIERTFYRDPRTPCRDYRRTTERAGAPSVAIEGTGCRLGSGRWSLDEDAPDPAREALFRSRPREPEAAEAPVRDPERTAAPQNCPALTAVPVPCAKPAAVVDYTIPAKTEL
jgi:surface antigen